MIEIIKDVFKLYGYEHTYFAGKILFKSPNTTNFWLLVETDPTTLLEEQADYLKEFKESIKDSGLAKNTHLICAWNVEGFSHETIRDIQRAEEDSYFFKKHILHYTNNEVKGFRDKISECGLLYLFNTVVMDSDVFSRYTNELSFGEPSWTSLLYRLCIKLNVIKVEKNEVSNLENLFSNHEKRINDSSKSTALLKSIERIALELELDENQSPEDCLEELLESLGEAGHEI